MAASPYPPIEVVVGEGIAIRVKQLDGVTRMGFAIEAEIKAEAIGEGSGFAAEFALDEPGALPVSDEASGRARRYQIEMTLALEWGLIDVEGADWAFDRPALARLVRFGDPPLGVPPLYLALGSWLRGPLREIEAAGERSGASSDGAMGAAPPTATDVRH